MKQILKFEPVTASQSDSKPESAVTHNLNVIWFDVNELEGWDAAA
jgi:hypothetical protein